eukprot:6856998-Prymnesium_polylepis.1
MPAGATRRCCRGSCLIGFRRCCRVRREMSGSPARLVSTVPAVSVLTAVCDACASLLVMGNELGIKSVRQPSSVVEIDCPGPRGARSTTAKS